MARDPKYIQLAAWLRTEISEGRLRPGDKIHSENALCAMQGISRQTVRQAIGLLEQEGLLLRRRGSGTYVAHTTPQAGGSQNIGVIMTYLDSYIFPAIIQGIEEVLTASGYGMQLWVTHNQPVNEGRVLRGLRESRLAGLLVEPTQSGLPGLYQGWYSEIERYGIPVVFMNAIYPGLTMPCVCLDDQAAGHMATRHLLEMGHRRIAGMFKADDRQGHLRYKGYLAALAEAGLDSDPSCVLWFTTEDIPYIEQDMDRVLRYIMGCTGLVCYNDNIAYPLCRLLRQRGIQVPQQLSVVGVDNAEITAPGDPPLTTIAHPMQRLGKAAAETLLRRMADGGAPMPPLFEPKLIERTSVRRMMTY